MPKFFLFSSILLPSTNSFYFFNTNDPQPTTKARVDRKDMMDGSSNSIAFDLYNLINSSGTIVTPDSGTSESVTDNSSGGQFDVIPSNVVQTQTSLPPLQQLSETTFPQHQNTLISGMCRLPQALIKKKKKPSQRHLLFVLFLMFKLPKLHKKKCRRSNLHRFFCSLLFCAAISIRCKPFKIKKDLPNNETFSLFVNRCHGNHYQNSCFWVMNVAYVNYPKGGRFAGFFWFFFF